MEQNNTLRHYLIIGLIINSFVIFLSSCKYEFYDKFGSFHFKNETNYTITYEGGLDAFNVQPKSTTIINEKNIGSSQESTASNYASPLRHYGKEIIIKFNNVKCLVDANENDVNSIRNIKNFIAERINKNTYKFTYTFTEADYNRAVACP